MFWHAVCESGRGKKVGITGDEWVGREVDYDAARFHFVSQLVVGHGMISVITDPWM